MGEKKCKCRKSSSWMSLIRVGLELKYLEKENLIDWNSDTVCKNLLGSVIYSVTYISISWAGARIFWRAFLIKVLFKYSWKFQGFLECNVTSACIRGYLKTFLARVRSIKTCLAKNCTKQVLRGKKIISTSSIQNLTLEN